MNNKNRWIFSPKKETDAVNCVGHKLSNQLGERTEMISLFTVGRKLDIYDPPMSILAILLLLYLPILL